MISILSGTIHAKGKDGLVIMTPGGVGYAVRITPLHLVDCHVGQDISLFTHLKVTDQSHELFGFTTAEERTFFSLLLTVSGVGPKSAMNVLSLGSLDQIQDAIARQDVKYLTAVQGMGKKTAERLVVELRSKVCDQRSAISDQEGEALGEVVEGLVALGYGKDEAREVVRQLEGGDKTSEQLLREALQNIG